MFSRSRAFIVALLASALLAAFPAPALAQTRAEAEAQIDAAQAQIERLRQEIAALEKDLNATTEQKLTLQNAIKALDLQIQKLNKSINLTSTQIGQKDREIGTLSSNIEQTSTEIGRTRAGVAESLRELQRLDNTSLVVALFGGDTLSNFFDEAVALESLRSDLQNKIEDLGSLKKNLEEGKSLAEDKRRELSTLKSELDQEKRGVSAVKSEQNTLLAQTKNKESEYQKLIQQKKAEQEKFEAELRRYEQSLGLSVAEGSIPAARAGVLQWPLAKVVISQYFGNTSFATKNPQIYGNKGHNAIDLAIPSGSPVMAARGGTVIGAGNTDLTCPNASYGKWVFIKHDNGLSTLYAHLSSISVSEGQGVAAGETIGFSGNTGYSTGPHLHFGVYASSGSKVTSFPSSSCRGKTYTMPVADVTAYLNPLSYLPAR